MATANSTTPLFPRNHYASRRPHSDLLVAFLKVGITVTGRSLLVVECPDVRHLVVRAHSDLQAAHDLIQSDRELAA